MDKTGFLKELKTYLVVLNESEQKDIIDEYAQHIDMKMEKGMSEVEAIKDFGNTEELVAEILGAYHVNPQYQNKKRLKMAKIEAIPVPDMAESGRHLWTKGCQAVKGMGKWVAAYCISIWGGMKKLFRMVKDKCSAVKERKMLEPLLIDSGSTQKKIRWKELPGRLMKHINNLLIGMIHIILWCIRWAWNGCMMLSALIAGICMLGCVFVLGVMVVLLMQGYPLLGLVIGSLGTVLCTAAMTMLAIGLVILKKRDSIKENNEVQNIQEVEHA